MSKRLFDNRLWSWPPDQAVIASTRFSFEKLPFGLTDRPVLCRPEFDSTRPIPNGDQVSNGRLSGSPRLTVPRAFFRDHRCSWT